MLTYNDTGPLCRSSHDWTPLWHDGIHNDDPSAKSLDHDSQIHCPNGVQTLGRLSCYAWATRRAYYFRPRVPKQLLSLHNMWPRDAAQFNLMNRQEHVCYMFLEQDRD